MKLSRRDLAVLFPALAANAQPQQKQSQPLPSKVYHDGQIPYDGNAQKKGRRFFFGPNRSGFNVELHETMLGPGVQAHDPHKHVHEEIVILAEGTLESNLEGRRETVEAGSVIFFASNEMHNVRNVGSTTCRYYVIELRGDEA
ncbi:MAG TPA: cupin domain-containing protein [Bryobacteraceae bacterium]|nr:cupin domain-containing protein [Bryobacteraceae bacterium]